jgi:hypothetical protein
MISHHYDRAEGKHDLAMTFLGALVDRTSHHVAFPGDSEEKGTITTGTIARGGILLTGRYDFLAEARPAITR